MVKQYIDKSALVAKIDEIVSVLQKNCNPNPMGNIQECLAAAEIEVINLIKDFLDTLEVKESDETAKAFARIIRANLTGIDKDVQYKFEQLYKEITGKKMYQGYSD